MSQPVAIVISGLPCSGKSTLATALQARLQLPLLAKDTFKEILFDTLGYSDRQWSKTISLAAYALLFSQADTLLSCGLSCILEANFRMQQHATAFARLTAMNVRIVQIHCHASTDILVQRYWQRAVPSADKNSTQPSRHPGHVDAIAADEIEAELRSTQAPLELRGELISCDTSVEPALAIERAINRVAALTPSLIR